MARTQITHKAPFIGATHPGAFAKCPNYPCAPNREATAHLREDTLRTAPEQAALDVVRDKAWILWHANDRDLGVLLVLSRAGLLRDKAYEKQREETAQSMSRIAQRESKAVTAAVVHLDALAEQAADRLEAGDDPREVAAWLRQHRDAIQARREQGKSHIAQPTPS